MKVTGSYTYMSIRIVVKMVGINETFTCTRDRKMRRSILDMILYI